MSWHTGTTPLKGGENIVKVILTVKDPYLRELEVRLYAPTADEAIEAASRFYDFGAAVVNGGWAFDNFTDRVVRMVVAEA